MTQDENQNSDKLDLNKISTDVKLLLCQLVLDAKNENKTWDDIYTKLTNHPIVTSLHRDDGINILETFTVDQLNKLVIDIINETISKSDIITTTNDINERKSRGRRPNNINVINDAEPIIEINPNTSYNLEYFQSNKTRQMLSICCSKLQKLAIKEIKAKLNKNRNEFAKIIREQLT